MRWMDGWMGGWMRGQVGRILTEYNSHIYIHKSRASTLSYTWDTSGTCSIPRRQ